MKKFVIYFLFFNLLYIGLNAQLSEGFNSTGWGGSYGNYTVNGWSLVNVYRETSNIYEGASAVRFNTSGSVKSITSPEKSNGIGTVTLYHRRWSSADGNVTYYLYVSTDGTNWGSALTSWTSTSDTYTQFSYDVNNASAKYIKIESPSTQKRALIDLITISDYSSASPTINISSTVLSDFSYIEGNGPSSPKSFTVSGENLTNDISISAPAAYEISTSESGPYFNSIYLTPLSGTVTNTTIYVRLIQELSANSYNQQISLTSTGADNKNVSCQGIVYKAAPNVQSSSISFSSISYSSATMNWTNGNGDKRIVVMNTENSFTNPVNGTDPIANTTYSGSGEQVIYNGTGNSVTVSGLSSSTQYWIRVYEYNNAGSNTMYLSSTNTDNPNSFTTLNSPCLSENFSSGSTPTGWIATNVSWTEYSGTASFNANTGELVTIAISNPQNLSFNLSRTTNTTAKTLYVEVSTTSQSSGFTTVATL